MFGLFKKLSDNPIELYQNIENGKQEKASIEKLNKLANDGNAEACHYLSLCYLYSNGVEENIDKFLEYLFKAANSNYYHALYSLGNCYYHGELLEKNLGKAVEYYKQALPKAPEVEISDIHYKLYLCYHEGGFGIEKNMDDAFYHLDKASEFNGEALFQLALWYFNGYYIDQNRDKAFEYFRMLANDTVLTHESNYESVEERNEELCGFGEANYYLALCFENGYGTSVQMDNAKYWYRKSAECGNEKAIKRLDELTD